MPCSPAPFVRVLVAPPDDVIARIDAEGGPGDGLDDAGGRQDSPAVSSPWAADCPSPTATSAARRSALRSGFDNRDRRRGKERFRAAERELSRRPQGPRDKHLPVCA